MKLETALRFTPYKFANDQDEEHSRKLTHLQRCHVYNVISSCVDEKINMPAWEPDYLIKQEFLRGQISILQFLLAVSSTVGADGTGSLEV